MSRTLWKFFTSLRLTVACLAFGVILVFLGTWAQVDEGLWQAQSRWFRSFFVWWTVPHSHLRLPIFPGGYLLGMVLLLNLLSAHIKRFSWTPRKLGIQLTHLGVILLLVGQLVTELLSHESVLTLHPKETKNYSETMRKDELVFISDTGDGQDEVISIPQAMVATRKEIHSPQLPCSIVVKEYHPNGDVFARAKLVGTVNQLNTALATLEAEFATPDGLAPQAERAEESQGREEVWRAALRAVGDKGPGGLVDAVQRVTTDKAKAERLCLELKTRFRTQMLERFSMSGDTMAFVAEKISQGEKLDPSILPIPVTEGSGHEAVVFPLPELTDMDAQNFPYAILELAQNEKSLGTWLVAGALAPQPVKLGEKTYRLALRPERVYHGFSATLLSLNHDVYLGTDIPKNYQSRVRIDNPASGETREVDIYMNNPLRYAGLTFYQYQMGAEEAQASQSEYTRLEVVRNPGWVTPYLGCLLVAAGMVYQFLFHLVAFIAKRGQARPASAKT